MEKGTKRTLSLNERVELALVPVKEHPVEINTNWIWTYINNIAFVTKLAGFEYTKYIAPNLVDIGVPLFKGKNVRKGQLSYDFESFIPKSVSDELTRSKVNRKCLLTPYVGAIGNVAIFNGEMECHLGSNVGKIEICNSDRKIMLEEYLLYYLRSDIGYEQLTKHKKATAQESISIAAIRDVCIPLPPLDEQQRIVDRIESLFDKLDRAKELVQNALDAFGNRKTAILHKAFIGELTAKWREENGVSINDWKKEKLKSVAEFRAGYAFDSKKFTDKGYQVIRMGNLYNGKLDLNRNPVFYPENSIEEGILKKSKVDNGDILLTLTGTKYKRDYGYAVLIQNDTNLLLNQRIVSLTAKSISTKYLLNYLKTDLFRGVFFSNETGGVNQGNVSSKFVENILIPVPLELEQKEIIRILDCLLENEQQAEELCDVLDKIDLMKKSILAKAFRGELGTNDPAEESAIELLKEVLMQKE